MPPTYQEFRKEIQAILAAGDVNEAQLKADWWLAENAGLPRLELGLHGKDPIPEHLLDAWERAQPRFLAHEPLQHILGQAEFRGLPFAVNQHVLVPRPETEVLVDWILESYGPGFRRVFDVGTGSGCIALSLAHARPQWDITGIDVQPEALRMARQNAGALHLPQVQFFESDLLGIYDSTPVDLIVANLPYIAEKEADRLPKEVQFDPPSALFAPDQGMALIKNLLQQVLKKTCGCEAIFLEIGEHQADSLKMFAQQLGYQGVTLREDWAGRPRFMQCGVPAC